MLKQLTVLALLLLSATGARAAILLDFVSRTATASGFEFEYKATLEPSAFMKPGDYFAVYDFAGLTNLSNSSFAEDVNVPGFDSTVTRFQVSQQNDGPIPLFGRPTDNPNIPNVIVTLGGTTSIVPNPNLAGLLLGTLTLSTPFGAETLISNAAVAHAQVDGSQTFNVGTVLGPVPEPGTYLLMGVGLAAVGVAVRKRRRLS